MRFVELPVAPAGTVVLQPQAWAATYKKRPADAVALGLRLPSEGELITAQAQATEEAAQRGRTGEARAWRFNEALVCWTLAAALCDPNDAGKPYFERADEEVRSAFPDETLRHLWHELERLRLETSPVRKAATDAEVADLATLLADGALAAVPEPGATRLRRLLRFVLEEIAQS